jgi:GT2 family glycosyltransferase
MFVRADVFKRVKGFDPALFAHMEEIDLCWRMKINGYKIYYIPNSTVFHVGGGALPKTNPHKTYLNFRNNLFLLYKNLTLKKLNKILLTRFFLDIIASMRFIVNFKLKFFYAIFKAYKNFYSNLSYLKSYRKSSNFTEDVELNGILEKSIVWEYYFKNNRTFNKVHN